MHNDHYIGVWDISRGAKVAEEKGGVDKILDLVWAPQGHRFCSVGIKHIMF